MAMTKSRGLQASSAEPRVLTLLCNWLGRKSLAGFPALYLVRVLRRYGYKGAVRDPKLLHHGYKVGRSLFL